MDRRPNNLPLQLSSFVGREREIAEVNRLLASARLLTLTGAGGSGKTRLALEVATDLLTTFADGVWLVECAPLADPALVPQAVASVLEIHEQSGRALAQTLSEQLRSKHLLLVLDNCEHLIMACAQLAEALLQTCPTVHILATSREALDIEGEITLRVPSLSVPQSSAPTGELERYESVRLFIERAAAAHANFRLTNQNAAAVTQICQRLDGIPLALELAAALVAVLSVEQMAARLDNIFPLLTTGRRTALPRHQTLRAALDWSHDLLSEPEQILFRRLSVLAGRWTLEAAEFVCQDAHESLNVIELLTRLINKSLVQADPREGETRYRLLEPLRQYAHEQLVEAGEGQQVRNRHLEFFLTLAEAIERKIRWTLQVMWLNRQETEHDNFRAALDWSLESAQAVLGLRLAATLHEFWDTHGHATEGRARLTTLLARPEALEPTAARAGALNAAGFLAWVQHDLIAARPLLEEALAIATALGERGVAASALHSLGNLAYAEGSFAATRTLHEQSLTIFTALDDKPGMAAGMVHVGLVALHDGAYDQAQRLFEESLTLSGEPQEMWRDSYICLRMGQTALHQGKYQKAGSLCQESLSLSIGEVNESFVLASIALFAALSAAQGQRLSAVRLYAAVGNLLATRRVQLRPYDDDQYHTNVAAIRAQLDEATFAQAWREGGQLTLEQAIAEVEHGIVGVQPSAISQAPTPASTVYPAGLTAREVEVLRWVARGLTDAQIAERLVISTRTVSSHLHSIYGKLDVTTRTAAVRVATEYKLV